MITQDLNPGWSSRVSYTGSPGITGAMIPSGSSVVAPFFTEQSNSSVAGTANSTASGIYPFFTPPAFPSVNSIWPTGGGDVASADTTSLTLSCQFSLSTGGALTGIRFYSPAGVAVLPLYACGIWVVSTKTTLAGTVIGPGNNSITTWSGAAGSGWVKVPYNGSVNLLASTAYKVAVAGDPGVPWYSATTHYWDSGPGASGITSGIITAPNNAGADVGQDAYKGGAWDYPDTSFLASNYWVDVEITI